MRHFAQRPAGEQLEGGLCTVIGVAEEFAFLHLVHQPLHARVLRFHLDAGAFELRQHIGAACLVGHQDAALVAHRFRRHMLIGRRVLLHRGDMQPALMGKGRRAHIGLMPVGSAVEDFIQQAADMGQLLQAVMGHTGLEAVGEFGLQHQGRQQRHHIGIAAALAQAIQRALDLPHPAADRGQRVGHGIFRVVMGMDAQIVAGDVLGHLADDRLHLMRQRAAIGVAQHHPARARCQRLLGAGDGVVRVGLVAIEKMLAVDHRLALVLGDGLHAVANGF